MFSEPITSPTTLAAYRCAANRLAAHRFATRRLPAYRCATNQLAAHELAAISCLNHPFRRPTRAELPNVGIRQYPTEQWNA